MLLERSLKQRFDDEVLSLGSLGPIRNSRKKDALLVAQYGKKMFVLSRSNRSSKGAIRITINRCRKKKEDMPLIRKLYDGAARGRSRDRRGGGSEFDQQLEAKEGRGHSNLINCLF